MASDHRVRLGQPGRHHVGEPGRANGCQRFRRRPAVLGQVGRAMSSARPAGRGRRVGRRGESRQRRGLSPGTCRKRQNMSRLSRTPPQPDLKRPDRVQCHGTACTTIGDERQDDMSDFKPGLEGVVAFETEIAEPDKEGGALRYRGRRHRGPRRPGLLRRRWGLLVDDSSTRACPRPSRTRSRSTPATSASTCRARWRCSPRVGHAAAARHRRRAGPRRPRAHLGDGAVVRRPVRARPRPADGAAERDRRGPHDHRAVHDPLARRARPEARAGDRRLLGVRSRARHERLHVHRSRHRLHRRRRRRGDVRRDRRDVRPAARRRACRACCT